MRSIRERKNIHFIGKIADYVERTCTGTNHSLQITVDEKTEQVDLLKISLSPNYSRFIIIDFYNQKCRVVLLKNNKEESILIPKMIIPDFPDLSKLKNKIKIYALFL